MASFGTFDTDFSGQDRFKDILENGGNVSVDQLKDFIKESVEALADSGDGEVRYKKFGNDFAVVIAYEPGFDPNDEKLFVDKDGYAICATIREAGSSYMVEDWKIIGDYDISLSTDDEADGFTDVANALFRAILELDPERVDDEGVDRNETVFDTLPDFSGAFETLKASVNGDDPIFTELTLGFADVAGEIKDAVIFGTTEVFGENDLEDLEKLFNTAIESDPRNGELKAWLEENGYTFTLVIKSKNEVAFVIQ